MLQHFQIMMMRMLVLLYFLYYLPLSFSLTFQNSSYNHLCHQDDKMSLLRFKNGFTIDPQFSQMYSQFMGDYGPSYPKTKSWKVNIDCCLWDGITCDSNSGHVIGLNLSNSQLGGIIHPNSTLFQLSHLQSLSLSINYFYESNIPPNMGHFSNLKFLSLSYCGFAGNIPTDLGLLTHLVSLDISDDLKMSGNIIKNLTQLRQINLNQLLLINTSILHTLANYSSLSYLGLSSCSLQGVFPSSILSLPHLRVIDVHANDNLFFDASNFNNLSKSLEWIEFSNTNLSGRLPEYKLGRRPPQLSEFGALYCKLYGTIPMWIWNTTEQLFLAGNQFSGELPSSINTKHLSQFSLLSLSYNLLRGPIPSWLLNLPSLNYLYLKGNQFTGKVHGPFPKDNCPLEIVSLSYNNISLELNSLSKCNNLSEIYLSSVSLIGGVNSTVSWPNLSILHMSSCNVTIFPEFLKSQQTLLQELDLSNNKIQGEIPTWFYNVGKDSLQKLNISHNNLTGGMDLYSWKGLDKIDIRSNSFQGLLPLPPSYTSLFLASSNKFHGDITSSFCNLTMLDYLDLSNNHLSGNIPQCFGKLSSNLSLLDLGSNNFHGIIPMTFTDDCYLQSIHLNDNQFEGTIPRSLKKCQLLAVLDLGGNQFNDSFPRWLDDLPELKVLVLRSNYFKGSIKDELKANINPFPKLQILDLSRNQFSGRLPASYIKKFKALMVENGDGYKKTEEYTSINSMYYQDSLVLTMKGLSLTYTYKILTILTTLDFSRNQFSGLIPESLGELVALVALNVSHNQLTGQIPPSLAKLTSLESLDLSYNKLDGKIPPELVSLTFLGTFSVSNNQLTGSIPQTNQFSTFPASSFEGNWGLCGDPLPKCRNGDVPDDHQPTTPSVQEVNDFIDIFTSISLWEIILIGFGLGATLGSVVGYFMLSAKKPNWFSRKADKFEDAMMRRYKKQSRRQQRRT